MRLTHPLLRLTWAELRRRKVMRAGAAYAIVAWVVLQIAEITFDPLGLPGWALTWTVLAAVLGLPVVLVLAWFFDVSAKGVAREQGVAGAAAPAFAVVVVLLTVAGLAWWLTDVYAPAPAAADDSARAVASSAPPNTIAVLPFDDMSPERDQGFLADGLAEELLDRLARSAGLKVAARTSSFAFREHRHDIREIGRQLNVRWVLEGSLRKAAGRIRVTAQLIDAADGFHVWSATYEHSDQDLFALQDEVTQAIAAELSQRVGGVAVEAEGDAGTDHAEALAAYLEGREAWRRRTPAALEQAERLFRRAVDLDPRFARAWSGLADTYLLQADYGSRALDDAVRLAEPAAVRAVTLGPQLGEAWASVGLLRMNVGQRDAARRSLEEAMRLDPRYEMAPMWLASVYASEGRYAEQRAVLERALELNPLEPVINANLAAVRAEQGEAEAAREQLLRVLAITPDDATLLRALAEREAGLGRLDAAQRAVRTAYATDPQAPANIHALLQHLALIEDFEHAEQLAHALPASSRNRRLALQAIELQRGGDRVNPEVAEWIATMPDSVAADADHTALVLAGQARLRAGAFDEAAALLQRASGSPGQLGEEPRRLEAASLLLLALRGLGSPAIAEWEPALEQAAREWLPKAGDSPALRFARALVALEEGQPDAALDQLEAAVDAGYRERWRLLYDPRLAALAGHPRLRALEQRLDAEFALLRRQYADASP